MSQAQMHTRKRKRPAAYKRNFKKVLTQQQTIAVTGPGRKKHPRDVDCATCEDTYFRCERCFQPVGKCNCEGGMYVAKCPDCNGGIPLAHERF